MGKHTIVEYFDCNHERLNHIHSLRQIMIAAAQKAGATVIDSLFHGFSPHGITGVVIVVESHLSIHTWPEYGYAAVDIFTCGDNIKNKEAIEYIKEELECRSFEIINVRRGRVPSHSVSPEFGSVTIQQESIALSQEAVRE
ncbi:MAG: adenosylmethionine decarboxylase [Candidatus Omnitrophica bacterium]|nr:adenosylmethionine decarboxylase [Candidatus Omnitrophota bacterium]